MFLIVIYNIREIRISLINIECGFRVLWKCFNLLHSLFEILILLVRDSTHLPVGLTIRNWRWEP